MANIGAYEQISNFTNENAGTAEWCKATRNGKLYFIKKFQTPVYPSKNLGLSEDIYRQRVERFHRVEAKRKAIYAALRSTNTFGAMVLPEEVIAYEFHICTVTEYIEGNLKPSDVSQLSEWLRLSVMRTLVLSLMQVHQAHVVHGDIKPDNLLISQNPDTGMCHLKLIDFDSSFMADAPPPTADEVGGDMAYWAPEVYSKYKNQDVKLDERIDDFSLGMILHYLWCGHLPGKDEGKTLGEHLFSGGKAELNCSLPLALSKAIERLLEPDPAKRLACQTVYKVLGAQLNRYPAPPPPGKVDINYYDDKGNIIDHEIIHVSRGVVKTITARIFDGYRIMGKESVVIRADSAGKLNEYLVTFRYTKKRKSLLRWIAALIAAAILYTGAIYTLSNVSIANQDWLQSQQYADLLPYFENLFPSQQSQINNIAMLSNGNFLEYMRGKWQYWNGEEARYVTVTDDGNGGFVLEGLPEDEIEAKYDITSGQLYFTFKGDTSVYRFSLYVENKDSIIFRSSLTNSLYYMYRQ